MEDVKLWKGGTYLKKLLALVVSAALIIIVTAGVVALNKAPEDFKLESLPKKLSLAINSSYHLKVKTTFESNGEKHTENVNKSCKFSSDDESLADVTDDGHITGRKVGKTSVNVTFGNITKKIHINVKKQNSTYVAHRGAMDFAPQGTIASISKAIKLGYSQIEFDLRTGGDGNIFVFHDRNLKYMCGINSDFTRITLKNRKAYPIISGANIKKLPTQYIPTVGEALDLFTNNKSVEMVYLHIKHLFTPKQARALENEIRSRKLTDRITLISADREVLRVFDKKISKGELCSAYDIDSLKRQVDEVKSEGIGINALLYQYSANNLPSDEFVIYAHKNGVRIIGYAIDDTIQFEQLQAKGINAIVCNRLLFKLDPSLIKCSLSIIKPDGSEAYGSNYTIEDRLGNEVLTFEKGNEPYDTSGILISGETYTLKAEGESTGQSFNVENTDEVQNIVFETENLHETLTEETAPSVKDMTLRAGETKKLSQKDKSGAKITYTVSDKKTATIRNGRIIALQKGGTEITAKSKDAQTSFNLRVSTSPKLEKKSVTVKKGKTVSMKLYGRAKGCKNKYTNTKNAEITSKKTADTLTVRGLKKGSSIIKITVNGKQLRLNVTVE